MTPEPNTSHAAIERVRSFFRATGWKRTQLATAAELNESTIRFIEHARWNPTVETLRALERLIPEGWQAGDPAPRQKDVAA